MTQHSPPEMKTSLPANVSEVLTVALPIGSRSWRPPVYPSADEQGMATGHSHTLEYYSAIKRNRAPGGAGTQMSLEGTLSDRSQSQEAAYQVIPFIEKSRMGN